jgi:transcriptional regulator with XRE-family HTH domain
MACNLANRHEPVKWFGKFIFPIANLLCAKTARTVRQTQLRADALLSRNIRALLNKRNLDDSALAAWCGHAPSWLSKILSGERGMPIRELGRVADYFGLEVSDLFQYGIDPLLERRRGDRRGGVERRGGQDRRANIEETPYVRPIAYMTRRQSTKKVK